MSNVNNYEFARLLDKFKISIMTPHQDKIMRAEEILSNPQYPWKDEQQKKAGMAQLENYKVWQKFYQDHYDEGKKLCVQHEQLTNLLCKWYAKWYSDVSNEGRQEPEMMQGQADILNSIFEEIFKELQTLGLSDIKAPAAMNLK